MKKWTGYLILAVIIALLGYDVFAYIKGGTEATISSVIIDWSYDYPAFTFMMGFVNGHWFWGLARKKRVVK